MTGMMPLSRHDLDPKEIEHFMGIFPRLLGYSILNPLRPHIDLITYQ